METLPPILPRARQTEPSSQRKKRRRVAQACIACRRRKSRCNGARPTCSACSELEVSCEYAAENESSVLVRGRYLETLEARLAELETRLSNNERANPPNSTTGSSATQSTPRYPEDILPQYGSPEDETSDHGALDPQSGMTSTQHTTVSIDQCFQSEYEDFGYFGSSSLVAFTRSISHPLVRVLRSGQAWHPLHSDSAVDVDSGGLAALRPGPLSPDESQVQVHCHASEPYEDLLFLPDRAMTQQSIGQYFDYIGVLLPFLHKETLLDTYGQIQSGVCRVRRPWLGILNMVLAMAAQRSSGPGMTAAQCYKESLPYYQRAMKLCDKEVMSHATLETVQYLLLLTQYLQGTDKAVRTWASHGLAVKAALQIGLHSEQTKGLYSLLECEVRKRTWLACFILDRTLSMAFGRPPTIPDSFMRLPPPTSFGELSNPPDCGNPMLKNSAEYLASTTSIFSILGTAVDLLYDNNLGTDEGSNIFATVSKALQVEQSLEEWKNTLPVWLQFQSFEGVSATLAPDLVTQRLRSITMLRYHYMRSLIHRPVLIQLLNGTVGINQETDQPRQMLEVGQRSVETCVQSSIALVARVHAVSMAGAQKFLLGTWWCALYFTFTAALNLFSAGLICHYGDSTAVPRAMAPIQMRRSFQQAIAALEILDEGNKTVEKCVRCLKRLDHAMTQMRYGETLSEPQGNIINNVSGSRLGSAYEYADTFLSQTNGSDGSLQQTFSFSEFDGLLNPDFDFLQNMVF